MAMLVITRWYIVWGCSMFMHFPASHVRNHRRAILCSVSNFLSNSTPKWDPKIYRSHIISGSFWDDCGTTNQCQSMPVPEGILFGSPWSSRWCWRQICGAIRGEPGDAGQSLRGDASASDLPKNQAPWRPQGMTSKLPEVQSGIKFRPRPISNFVG